MGSSLVPVSWWGSDGFVALSMLAGSNLAWRVVPSLACPHVLLRLFDPVALSDVEDMITVCCNKYKDSYQESRFQLSLLFDTIDKPLMLRLS